MSIGLSVCTSCIAAYDGCDTDAAGAPASLPCQQCRRATRTSAEKHTDGQTDGRTDRRTVMVGLAAAWLKISRCSRRGFDIGMDRHGFDMGSTRTGRTDGTCSRRVVDTGTDEHTHVHGFDTHGTAALPYASQERSPQQDQPVRPTRASSHRQMPFRALSCLHLDRHTHLQAPTTMGGRPSRRRATGSRRCRRGRRRNLPPPYQTCGAPTAGR
jgi:hypothetical protein